MLLELLVALVLAAIPLLTGVGLAACLLPAESRLPVLLGGGSAAGVGLFVFGLLALVRLMPIWAAIPLMYAAAVIVAGLGLISLARRRPSWNVSARWTLFAVCLLLLLSVGAGVDLAASVWNGSTHENLGVRMAMTAHMARSDWPIADPYAPDHRRLYRYGAQLWAASIMRVSPAGLYPATLAVTVTAVLAMFGGVFGALAALRSYLPGFLAAAAMALAAPANILGFWKIPFWDVPPSRAYMLAQLERRIHEGFLLAHGFGLVPGNDFTIAVAAAAGAGGAFMLAAAFTRSVRKWPLVLASAACFAGMGAAAEQTFPPVAAALLISGAGAFALRRPAEGLVLASTGLAASVLLIIPESPLSAILLQTETGSRAAFSIGLEHALTLPTSTMLHRTESPFFAAPLDLPRVSLVDPIVLKEIGWIYISVGLVVLIAVRRRIRYLLPIGLAAMVALIVPGLVTDRLYPTNVARFTSLGIYLGGIAAGAVTAELILQSGRLTYPRRALAAALLVAATGTSLAAISLWPVKVYESRNTRVAEDLEAADFARELPYGARALVLPGPSLNDEVDSDRWEGQLKFAVSFGTLFVPIGLDLWGNFEQYRSLYTQAYGTLDATAMGRLKIDTVLVAPQLLSSAQRGMVEAAAESGRLRLIYETSGGARRIYRYRPAEESAADVAGSGLDGRGSDVDSVAGGSSGLGNVRDATEGGAL